MKPVQITPFLMFTGRAEEAMRFYTTLFEGSTIEHIDRYGESQGAAVGSVRHAVFVLRGQRMMCIDSPTPHGFSFTPATSLHVALDDEAELDRLYAALSEAGQVLMPMAEYPFSRKYAWVNDRFGVSWQLMLQEMA